MFVAHAADTVSAATARLTPPPPRPPPPAAVNAAAAAAAVSANSAPHLGGCHMAPREQAAVVLPAAR